MRDVLVKDFPGPDEELKKVYARKIEQMLQQDSRVLSLDGDLMRTIATVELWRKYPSQVFQCGIAEANMIGVAAGLSSEGYIPFVHSFGAFSSRRVVDQVFMSCAYAKLNVKIIGSDPGIVSQLNGGTHAANEDIAIMRSMPGITVVDITDTVMLPQIMDQAAKTYGVFYLRVPRCAVPRVYASPVKFEIGRSKQLTDGGDAAIIASGIEVHQALEASAILASSGINARVIDMFTIAPLDKEAVIRAALETGAIVTAENHNINGGLGSAVAECLAENSPCPMERIASTRFSDVGTLPYLIENYGLSANHIAEAVKKAISRKTQA